MLGENARDREKEAKARARARAHTHTHTHTETETERDLCTSSMMKMEHTAETPEPMSDQERVRPYK